LVIRQTGIQPLEADILADRFIEKRDKFAATDAHTKRLRSTTKICASSTGCGPCSSRFQSFLLQTPGFSEM
jgi:hypothetical protein